MVEHGPFPLFQARGAKKIQGYSQVVYRPAGRDKRTARGQNQVESRKPLTYLIIWGGSRTSIPKEMFSAICDHRGCERITVGRRMIKITLVMTIQTL